MRTHSVPRAQAFTASTTKTRHLCMTAFTSFYRPNKNVLQSVTRTRRRTTTIKQQQQQKKQQPEQQQQKNKQQQQNQQHIKKQSE